MANTPSKPQPQSQHPKALSERKAAMELGVDPATLKRWRDNGEAPPHFTKQNPGRNTIRYPREGLRNWKRQNGLASV